MPRHDRTQWTGIAPNGTYLRALARNTGEVFGVFGVLSPKAGPFQTATYANSVKLSGLQALEEKPVILRAPRWPEADIPLDPALIQAGGAVSARARASCHAAKPSTLVRNAWATPLADAGTDRLTFDRSMLRSAPGVLLGTRQPVLTGPRLTADELKASILANAVIGSLGRAALLLDPAIRRAIEQTLHRTVCQFLVRLTLPPLRLARLRMSRVRDGVASVVVATYARFQLGPAPDAMLRWWPSQWARIEERGNTTIA